MIAALYVLRHGPYADVPDVELWYGPPDRDARLYQGPWPVVAHPPCARWGSYWFGGPHPHQPRRILGDDDGCFVAALAAVRRWGGVLEHPAYSHAWAAFGLFTPPRAGGWVVADWFGGWTCHVEQGAYGHPARKPTWLYAAHCTLPALHWGRAPGSFQIKKSFDSPAERRRLIRRGIVAQLSHRQRQLTPAPFRDLLLAIARTAHAASVP